ncbi:hypothetical protein HAX54_004324, partial [Datura stramonium]|nr:hypothetical protein [Datura stramonium]
KTFPNKKLPIDGLQIEMSKTAKLHNQEKMLIDEIEELNQKSSLIGHENIELSKRVTLIHQENRELHKKVYGATENRKEEGSCSEKTSEKESCVPLHLQQREQQPNVNRTVPECEISLGLKLQSSNC